MANGNKFTGGDVQSVKLGLNYESFPYYYQNHLEVMGASGKVLFTANQWQELERQKKIYMYIMASIPVPPQLLLPLSAQSNRVVGTGLRFSNGSDPEPWRCRRTDGKKWRCSKDVAPDQKYCERHAHKTRTRSRKPVETQSQIIKEHHSIISGANHPTRCSDWFLKNDTVPASSRSQSNNHFQIQMQSPSSRSKKDLILKQDLLTNHQQNPYNYCLNTGSTDVDAWSRIGGGDECSLTLSMQSGGNESEFDHESFQMAVGMLRGDRDTCGDVFKPSRQLLNQASWVGSGLAPGGPLGEALCLGMTSSQSEPYSHGYSYSTTTSSSCEGGGDGGHGLDFNFVNRHDD